MNSTALIRTPTLLDQTDAINFQQFFLPPPIPPTYAFFHISENVLDKIQTQSYPSSAPNSLASFMIQNTIRLTP